MFWIIVFIFLVLIPGIGNFLRALGRRLEGKKAISQGTECFKLEMDTDKIAGVEHATIHQPNGSVVNLVRIKMKDGTEGAVRTIDGKCRLTGGRDEMGID